MTFIPQQGVGLCYHNEGKPIVRIIAWIEHLDIMCELSLKEIQETILEEFPYQNHCVIY